MNPDDIARRLRSEARDLPGTADPELARRILAAVRADAGTRAPAPRTWRRHPARWLLAAAAGLLLALALWQLRPVAVADADPPPPAIAAATVQAPVGSVIAAAHRPLQAERSPLEGELDALRQDLASVAGFLVRVPPGVLAE